MTPDAKLRMDVYQEGQRAFSSGAICPYTDWRAKTWAKGHAAAKEWRAFNEQSEAFEAISKQEGGGKPVDIDWNAVHEKLELVWYQELSADEGLDEIQYLIDTTPPQQRTWVGLTDEERNDLCYDFGEKSLWSFADSIEAKLRKKNT